METDMEIKDIGQRIAKLRKEKGYSQVELAKRLNVSDKTVSKWENGGMPSIDLLPALASLLDVSIDYLMTGNEKVAPAEENVNIKEEAVKEETPAPEKVEAEKPAVKPAARTRPTKCTCAKCGKVNFNPSDHCTYCYHTFTLKELMGLEDEEEEEVAQPVEVLPETLPNDFVCPKCGRVNNIPGENCTYCYHSFSAYTRKGAKASVKNNNSYSDNYKKKYAQKQNTPSHTTNYVIVNQQNSAGCLAYFLAFCFPIVGIIWGAVQKDKGLIIFSVVWAILSALISAIFSMMGLLLI